MSLKDVLERAREKYNLYRKPEATAEIVSIDEKEGVAEIKIVGSFCRTCGVDDWIEDFRILLEDEGITAKLEEYRIDFEGEEARAKLRIELPRRMRRH
ncbi:MAG: hypothetical protein QXT69_04535 [Fervidicoccaceae archaeon]